MTANSSNTVQLAWPTYLIHGDVSVDIVAALSGLEPGRVKPRLIDEYLVPWLAAISAGQFGGSLLITIDARVEVWEQRFSEALCERQMSNVGAYTLFFALETVRGPKPSGRSGTVVLHDPRAGSASIFVPGSPFGRTFSATLSRGSVLLVPSWMRHSVLPVAEGESLKVLRATLAEANSIAV